MSIDQLAPGAMQAAIRDLEAPPPGSSCPAATQNEQLNLRNQEAATRDPRIQYRLADNPQSACGNCSAFDVSHRMSQCMPGETQDAGGRSGYCWTNSFKCQSARVCNAWARGGPIQDDKNSNDRQNRETQAPKAGPPEI